MIHTTPHRPRRHNAFTTAARAALLDALTVARLDPTVTEVVLARIQRPDFLARVGQEDNGVDEERAALLEEIRAAHRR